MTLAAFLLVRQEAVMGQVTTVSWAPGFLQGSDCCGPNGPAAPLGALVILATVGVGPLFPYPAWK